jgi:TPP-dependent pyruvate/acetoin dehydrogenase alpha subunit
VAPKAGITEADLEACRAEAKAMVKAAVDFADASPPPPAGLGKLWVGGWVGVDGWDCGVR